ncbi:Protein NUCLEAR FUSION DEFECTIVE 4, partial [Bienertia sinuspersici]
VFFLCLLGGCSIYWFNTVCFVLCIKNFSANRALALSLTVGFNGVSAAQPKLEPLPCEDTQRDSFIFLFLNFFAVLTGLYLLFFSSSTNGMACSQLLFGGAILLLIFPLCVPGIVYAREWFKHIHSNFNIDGSGFILVDDDDLELHKNISTREGSYAGSTMSLIENWITNENGSTHSFNEIDGFDGGKSDTCCGAMIAKHQLVILFNNLGQIAQSLGQTSNTSTLITLYSSFSFFGRFLSAAPDYARVYVFIPESHEVRLCKNRVASNCTYSLTPTPIAFFLLTGSGSALALKVRTAMIGLSSGFIFAAAVSITSELFGPLSLGVNHNILITNIPIGPLVYGLLAAVVYDSNAGTSSHGISM